jgi:hypothetical protein
MEITGPTGGVGVDIDVEGRELAVERGETTVLESVDLDVEHFFGWIHGVAWADGGDVDVSDPRSVEETYEMAQGKARERTHEAVETTLTYTHPDADASVEVDLRVATDGVAFRYRVNGEARHSFYSETTTVSPPADAMAWVMPWDRAHESNASQDPVVDIEGEYLSPALFSVDGEYCLVCEAGVDGDYPASHFAFEGGTAAFETPTHMMNAHLPLETPWRVALVGGLDDVVESTLVTDLAGEPAFDGPCEPGRVAWSWWSESESPTDFERQRDYVDYAAERGWEYVLFDAGWRKHYDEMAGLVEYATDAGVDPIVWAHWTDLNTEAEREEQFSEWADWGVAAVKIDFMDHDDQGRMQFYDRVAEDAAEHGIMLNFHGSIVPTGLQRRHPNVMTYEGVYGAEWYKWQTVTPEHNCTLPFTRNVLGPMDYTPVTFSTDNRHTSAGHELALSVVFESALQHFADGIDEYAARPAAESFLESVPAAWEETRFVGGRPGTEATVARRTRDDHDGDAEWFLGSITAGPQRIVTADCSFLPDGEWTAHVVSDDGEDGLVSEEWTVTDQEALDVVVAPNGGFAARFTEV